MHQEPEEIEVKFKQFLTSESSIRTEYTYVVFKKRNVVLKAG